MSSRIDRNDVDIFRLFYYADEFTISGKNGKTLKVYIRLVGDSELNQARVFALRESRKMRDKLKNPDSDEALAFLPNLDDFSKEEIIQLILSAKSGEILRQANRDVKITLPTEINSDASLEEQEEYQKEVDNFDEVYNNRLTERISQLIVNEEEKLKELSIDKLKQICLDSIINQIAESVMMDKFRQMCVYFGTYKDKNYTNRLFKSFEEFDKIPPEIKSQLIACYNKLDIGDIELKK